MSEFLAPISEEVGFASMIQQMEAAIVEMEPAKCPIVHRFAPGLYIREFHGGAGVIMSTMRHKHDHPFIMSKGKIQVISENEGAVIYEAPCAGITKAGTHRLVYFLEDTIWTTVHATDKTDVEEIILEITDHPDNPLVPHDHPNANQWRRELPEKLLS